MHQEVKSLANVWANRRQVEDRLGAVYVFTEDALQVFADNLVNQCVKIAAQDLYSGHSHSDFSTGADWALSSAIKNIKEHFGVNDESR